MNPERRSHEPDPDGSELYQFADEPPPLPPRSPVPVPEPLPPPPPLDVHEGEIDLGDEAPRPRRKKKRRAEAVQKEEMEAVEVGEEPVEAPIKPPRDILEREDLPPPRPWWVVPTILSVLGFALCLVPIVVYASQKGTSTGIALVALTIVAVVIQVMAVTAFLTAIGTLFGIDYGPAVEAVGKLAAVVLIVDGLTGVSLLFNPCALVTAAIIGAGVFQYLFRLSVFEMLLSVAGMVGASWVLNAAVIAILASKA